MNNSSSKYNYRIILLHVLVWLSLFSLPYILSWGQKYNLQRTLIFSTIPLVISVVIFYINYLLLVNGVLIKNKLLPFLLVNTVIILAFVWFREELNLRYLFDLLPNPSGERPSGGPSQTLKYYVSFVGFSIPIIIAVAVKTIEQRVNMQNEHREAMHIRLESELLNLKYQLQPHFFFNALNNIYSMVDVAPEKAKESIHTLGKLMRYLLHETNTNKVSLQKEIDFMTKYIELMKLRFPERVKVNYNFNAVDTAVQIEPLLFISLIENAFKHGISAANSSVIIFNLTAEDGKVIFTSSNPLFPKNKYDKSVSGIGLQNLKKRLTLLYPGKYQFTINKEAEAFEAFLSIDY